jgi:D-xylose transport system substrate-binding protein
MIKGSPTDPNADFLRGGQQEILQEAIDAGDITIVGEAYTDGWLPANAQRNMEQILTANDNNVDAVVASNDGTAGGVVAALTAQGMEGIPVSGQDGDHAALNRVARHADRLGLEGRARSGQVQPAKSPWPWRTAPRWRISTAPSSGPRRAARR